MGAKLWHKLKIWLPGTTTNYVPTHVAARPHLPPAYAPLSLAPSHPSLWLGTALGCAYIAAIISIIWLPIPIWGRLGLGISGVALAWLELALHIWRNIPWAITEATWDQQGNWELKLASGDIVAAKLAADSFVTRHLVVLNFRMFSQTPHQSITAHWLSRSLILTADTCDPEVLRRLRVRLRLEYSKTTMAKLI